MAGPGRPGPPPRTSSSQLSPSTISSPTTVNTFTSPIPTISSTFPSRSTSRPTAAIPAPIKVSYPSYDHNAFRSDSPLSFSHTPGSASGGTSTPTRGGWGALRRAVLPPHRNWPVLNSDGTELHYPSYSSAAGGGGHSGRETPIGGGGGRSTPTAHTTQNGGLRFGKGRKRKQQQEYSVQQKFNIDLANIEEMFRKQGESSTTLPSTAFSSPTPQDHTTKRRPTLPPTTSFEGPDPMRALATLDVLLRSFSNTSIPDPNAVLAILLKPFRGDVGPKEEKVASVALDVFVRMGKGWESADGEEEVERWRWMLKAMEWDSVDLRNRLQPLLVASLQAAPSSPLFTSTVSSLTFLSLLSSFLNTLYTFSPLRPPALISLILSLSRGEILTPDPHQLALSLGFPLTTFEAMDRETLSRIVVFEGVLLISVGGEKTLREWLLEEGEEGVGVERFWVGGNETGGLMGARLVSLWARVCHLLLSTTEEGDKKQENSEDPFVMATEGRAGRKRARMKRHLHRIIFKHYPISTIASLSPALRSRAIYCVLSFFSHLPSTSYLSSATSSSLSPEESDAKRWIAEAWRVDKAAVGENVKLAMRELELDAVAGVAGVMMMGMGEAVCKGMVGSGLGSLFERINGTLSTATNSQALLTVLRLLSSRHPQTFFKPLFSLSSTSSRQSLSTLISLSTLLNPSDYLLKDAEMMVVALMADLGENNESGGEGRLAIMLELVRALRGIRKLGDEGPKVDREAAVKFGDAFESRLSLFIQKREQTALLPFSQRILLCTLLFELRMLTKPLHRPLWLPRMLVWATSSTLGSKATLEPRKKDDAAPKATVEVTQEMLEEPQNAFEALKVLYENSTAASPRLSRANVPAPSLQTTAVATAKETAERLKARIDIVDELSRAPLPPVLVLLVAGHSSLTEADLTAVCRVAWMSLDDSKRASFLPACFLVLLCGEKILPTLESLLSRDIKSSTPAIRQAVIVRLMSLFSARFDILSQPSADRSRRKPFKAARQQIGFVPLEVGSPAYVAPEEPEETRLRLGGSLPPDVYRALKELGWDEQSEERTLSERQRRPLTLLPWSELAFHNAVTDPLSPGSPNPGSLLRRNSSAGNYVLGSGKKKPIITPAFASIFLRLTELLRDPDVGVATTSREALMTLLRDDPAMLCRPLLVNLSGGPDVQLVAVRRLRQVMSIQGNLPCGAAHHLFNHIGGLLKGLSREVAAANSLQLASVLLPPLATLAAQISDFSLRDLRKNKVEHLFLTSGAFWYDSTVPSTSMFPRTLPSFDATPFQHLAVHTTVFYMAMIRIAQNTLQLGYLHKSPREAPTLKKLINSLSLPSTSTLPPALDTTTYLPKERTFSRFGAKLSREAQDELRISALVARSWLLSLIQVLQGMNRHFNVRSEITTLFDGVNRILLVHGSDTNIVGLALRACMLASTRFRRMFASNNGFSIFVPSLFKVFVDARDNNAIRSSVQYAWQRFFRSHEESFVFQAFGALTPIFAVRDVNDATRRAMSDDLFHLIEALQGNLLDVADIAGIRGANEREEREALIHQANDRPEIFLATFTHTDVDQASRLGTALGDAKPFALENSLKLFFTVIAFDPMSKRAGEFLHLFRLLVGNFFCANDKTKAVLRDGIEALTNVFSKASGGKEPGSAASKRSSENAKVRHSAEDAHNQDLDGTTEGTTAWLAMRRSFLLVVEAFHNCGGDLGTASMHKILDIVRITLREPTPSSTKASAAFIQTYTTSVIGPGTAPTNLQVTDLLKELAPFVRLYIEYVDFSPFFDVLGRLRHDVGLRDDPKIALLVTQKVVGPTLDACSAFSRNDTFSKFPSHRAAVRLVATWATNPASDAMAELTRQKATPSFLGTFVLPLAIELASQDSSQPPTKVELDHWRSAWLRIVGYAMSACLTTLGTTPRSAAATTAISLQIIKVALVGGEAHLTESKGSWLKVSGFIRELLSRGGGAFLGDALDVLRRGSSLAAPQRRSQGPLDEGPPSPIHPIPKPAVTALRFTVTIADYTLWSLFELLSLYPSPLLLHLRIFIREKLVSARFAAPQRALGRNDSVTSSIERRRGSSVFAKPLLSNSATSATAAGASPFRSRGGSRSLDKGADLNSLMVGSSSPKGSPVLGASRHHRRASSVAPSDALFRPTLEVFARDYLPISTTTPALPSPTTTTFPKIQHLGLIKNTTSFEYLNPATPVADATATISSAQLAAQTVERVRTVQIVFGESPIDIPGRSPSAVGEEEKGLKAWTKAEALRGLLLEASELEEEFSDILLARHRRQSSLAQGEREALAR